MKDKRRAGEKETDLSSGCQRTIANCSVDVFVCVCVGVAVNVFVSHWVWVWIVAACYLVITAIQAAKVLNEKVAATRRRRCSVTCSLSLSCIIKGSSQKHFRAWNTRFGFAKNTRFSIMLYIINRHAIKLKLWKLLGISLMMRKLN